MITQYKTNDKNKSMHNRHFTLNIYFSIFIIPVSDYTKVLLPLFYATFLALLFIKNIKYKYINVKFDQIYNMISWSIRHIKGGQG